MAPRLGLGHVGLLYAADVGEYSRQFREDNQFPSNPTARSVPFALGASPCGSKIVIEVRLSA